MTDHTPAAPAPAPDTYPCAWCRDRHPRGQACPHVATHERRASAAARGED